MQLPAVSGVTEWEMENAVSWKLGSHVTGISDKYNVFIHVQVQVNFRHISICSLHKDNYIASTYNTIAQRCSPVW